MSGDDSNNNNTNIYQDDLHGAVIVLQSLLEFTQFIWWMQTQCQMAANTQTKPMIRLLLSTSTITVSYYYVARKLMLILPYHGGWNAVSPRQRMKGAAACVQDCALQWLFLCTSLPAAWFKPTFSHATAGCTLAVIEVR